jgi:hypothetical protein
MDVVAWIAWLAWSIVGLVWSLLWFLIGGWVATLAQIGVIVLVIFGYKYGWRRAPHEVVARLGSLLRLGWAWIRTREAGAAATSSARGDRPQDQGRRARRAGLGARRRQPGDVRVNISTLLSLLMIAGLWMLAGLR